MKKYITLSAILITLFFTGCASTPQSRPYGGSNAVEKGIAGAVLGGIAGGVIGHQSGERDAGIAVGAATGAIGGYAMGNEQDKRLVRGAPQVQYPAPAPQRPVVIRQSRRTPPPPVCYPQPRPRREPVGYYHGTNRPRYEPRYRDYVPAGAPPPRPRR